MSSTPIAYLKSIPEFFRPTARIHVFAAEKPRMPRCVGVVEWLRRSGLAMRMDPGDIEQFNIRPGERVELGFGLTEARMYFLSAAVVREVDGTSVIVSYPELPRKQPRRGAARVLCEWGVELVSKSGAGALKVTTIDVSSSGALLAVETPVPPWFKIGETLGLRLHPDESQVFSCDAKIVRSAGMCPRTLRMLYGVRFVGLAESEECRLQLAVLRGIARRYLRVEVKIGCQVVLWADSSAYILEGTSLNMSGSGMMIRSEPFKFSMRPGLRGQMHAELPGGTVHLGAVEVIRVLPEDDTGACFVVDYSGASRESRSAVVEFVMANLVKGSD